MSRSKPTICRASSPHPLILSSPHPLSHMRSRSITVLLLTAALIWALPLVGVWLAGQPLQSYLDFPPRTRFVPHAPFEWVWFVLMSLPAAGVIALYWIAITRGRSSNARSASLRFPWWGWLGVSVMAVSWFCAWHGELPAEWRRHIFTPLWSGYILMMNALALRRTGWSPLTHRTAWFLALFPVSGVFWWLFEHLNQFVSNWYYSGIKADSDWDYFLQATLPFSTVLPAVASTWAWLQSFPRLQTKPFEPIRGHPALAWIALGAGVIALACIGIWPDALFAMLWLAPLLIVCALQQLLLGETPFGALKQGDWRVVMQPALAALICGFLWELWNFGSLARWHYSIPYVQRFHLFEMPLLGYAGYLPFGIECALVMDLVARLIERHSVWPLNAEKGERDRQLPV